MASSCRPERKLSQPAKATPAAIEISGDDDFAIPPVAGRLTAAAASASDLFPALSEPFDASQEPSSSKAARALISTAKALVSGGQLLPESAFLWLSSILLSEKIASATRTSAFVVLTKVAESVAHVPRLCASGKLAQLYVDRVARPLKKGARIMNEDLNSFLHVLDIMFADDSSGSTDSRQILADFVGDETRRSELYSLTRRAVSAVKKHKGTRALTEEVRKTSLARLRRFRRFFRSKDDEKEDSSEGDGVGQGGASSTKSGKEARSSDDESDAPAQVKSQVMCPCLSDEPDPECSEPAAEAKDLALVLVFEDGKHRRMSKNEMKSEASLLSVCFVRADGCIVADCFCVLHRPS